MRRRFDSSDSITSSEEEDLKDDKSENKNDIETKPD